MDPLNLPRRLGTANLPAPNFGSGPGTAPLQPAPGAEAPATAPRTPAPTDPAAARRSASFSLPDALPGSQQRTTGNLSSFASLKTWLPAAAEAIQAQVKNPDGIAQMPGKGTCVAATVQKTLARQNPELYAAIASDLVMLGASTLPNGTRLSVSPVNLKWIDAQALAGPQKVDALLQAALMELGAPGQGYVLASDRFTESPAKPPGLSFDQARRMIESLLKTPILDPRALKATWDGHHQAAGTDATADPLDVTMSLALARRLLAGAEAGSFAVLRARDAAGALLRDENGRPLVEGPGDEPEGEARPLPKRSHLVQIIALDEAAATVTYIDALGTQRTVTATTFARVMLMSLRSSDLEGIGSPLGAAI